MSSLPTIHIQQLDHSDCGIACLSALLQAYGSFASFEALREASGTSASGTTLLGLAQAAQKFGLQAEGFQAEIHHLQEAEHPCILHVHKGQEFSHFIICYSFDAKQNAFIVSDPAETQLHFLSPQDLKELWVTQTLLLVQAGPNLKEKTPPQKWAGLKWLSGFSRPDYNYLFTALSLGGILAVLSLAVALYSQQLVDIILPEGDVIQLFWTSGLLLFLLLLRALFSYLRQLFLTIQQKKFNIRILDFFYQKLLYLNKPFFDNRKTGDLIARLNDTARIQQTIAILFSSLAIDLLMVLISTSAILFYSRPIGLLAFLWVPIFMVIVLKYSQQILEKQRGVMGGYAMAESNYIDTIQGIGTIKVYQKEAHFETFTRRVYSLFQEARYQLGLTGLQFSTSAQVASSLFMVTLMVYSSYLVIQQELSIGGVMAIIQLLGLAMASAGTIANAYIQLQEARVALDRMQAFTELDAEFHPNSEEQKDKLNTFQLLEVKNLRFRFTGRPVLLDQISFTVQSGELIAILGESGCGKSTLLQILQRFWEPETGTILINGKRLSDYSLPAWRKLLGVVPQDVEIFNTSILENITLENEEDVDIAHFETIMNKYGLGGFFRKFPASWQTLIGESGINLSGGQRQLLGLARALYHQPALLLLDEATSAMDRQTEQTILQLLHRLKKEMGIILVTHRIHSASLADRIYLIEEGKTFPGSTPQELMQSDNLYSRSIQSMAKLIEELNTL
ncbi:MAG: peptidase domain-containing ABC transporter [Bacteroidota bacterium]